MKLKDKPYRLKRQMLLLLLLITLVNIRIAKSCSIFCLENASASLVMCCFFSLLAMGVDQFGQLPNKYVFVQKFLLPNKTNNQLAFRYKNLNSSRMRSENAVKV